MALLTLGGESLTGFEVPSRIFFGGAQQLAVHRLIGGTRVIDVMGPDDSEIKWSGVFSGTFAGDRARLFDAMRVAGLPLSLSWSEFCYTVVIEDLTIDFRNPWWIPYQISCAVVVDQAQAVLVAMPDLSGAILNDLSSAGSFFNVSSAVEAISSSATLIRGSVGYTAASLAVANTVQSINTNVASVETSIDAVDSTEGNLTSTDLALLVSSSGSLAQLCTARGYVGRCANNLSLAGT